MVRENGAQSMQVWVAGIVCYVGVVNVLGLIPYVSTPTAQIVVTMGLSVSVLVGTTMLGVVRSGYEWLGGLMPGGAPLILGPIMVVVETVSYVSRGVSLGVRLAANMTSGHLLYALVGGIVGLTGGGVMALVVMLSVVVLEAGVAVVQAYVYGMLTAIYVGEAMEGH